MGLQIMQDKCPECGEPMVGAADWIPGIAWLDRDEDTGEYDYIGETKVFWDGQCNAISIEGGWSDVERRAKMVLVCDQGHMWSSAYRDVEYHIATH